MKIDETSLKLLLKALSFAANKHKDQRRKDIEVSPYINHPISLANILCNEAHITDVEIICGALLHDTVEDTNTTPNELEEEFGSSIKNIVMDVTDDMTLPKDVRKRKQIEHAAHILDKSKQVKIADKISNLRDVANNHPPDWGLERRQKYFDHAKNVIDQLRGVHPALEATFDTAYLERPK